MMAKQTASSELANWEIFLWALNNLHGASQFIDIEDIFVKCFEYAPNKFSWRTKKTIPDYKKCSKALRDAEARTPQLLVKTKDGFLRQLTVEGQIWVRGNADRLSSTLDAAPMLSEPRNRMSSQSMVLIEKSGEFEIWQRDGLLPNEKWRMAELLQCSSDSDQTVWLRRMETLRSVANSTGKAEVLSFLDAVFANRSGWFSNIETSEAR